MILLFSMIFLTSTFQSNLSNYQNRDTGNSIIFNEETESADERPDVVIYINGSSESWEDAKTAGWVDNAGDGSYGNPYVIKDKIIDGENLKHGILIENWGYYDFYFRIENCTFINIGSSNDQFPKAGISIHNVGFDWMTQGGGIIQNNEFDTNSDLDNYGIYFFHSGNSTFSNNVFTDFKHGIYFDNGSRTCSVSENLFTDNQNGIFLDRSCNNINITENDFLDNAISGLYVLDCYDILIYNNYIEDNTNFGVIISACVAGWNWGYKWGMWGWYYFDPIRVIDNTISKNNYGIFLDSSVEQQIKGNDIIENNEKGIWVFLSVFNNITDNTISDNTDKGIVLDDSNNNKINYNFFLRNGEHAIDGNSKNNFSINGIGNYWDNYSQISGVADDDDDGIGDLWYNFTGGRDKYPLYNDGIFGDIIEIDADATGYGAHNWTWAREKFWCSGNGQPWDPYVISPSQIWDGIIDGNGKTCITIENSDYQYGESFRIEGCTIKNSGSSGAGIQLNNSGNAVINNNNITNNGIGISLNWVFFTNFTDNTIINSLNKGIYLTNHSNMNDFICNTISSSQNGTYLEKDSKDNEFILNIFENNAKYGAVVADNISINNVFYENTFRGTTTTNEYALDNTNTTMWYKDERGNSWGDYVAKTGGSDLDDDGIGNVKYDIIGKGNNKDIFPLYDDGLNGQPLYINGAASGVDAHNWTWASKRLYISGNGTQLNPYVIKDVTISGLDSESAIIIENSDWTLNTYFRIENCTLTDIGGSGRSGIKLYNVTNGEIIDNEFSTDNVGNYGIHTERCSYISIEMNTISSNEQFDIGIYLDKDSHHINIVENEINDNLWGIYLHNMTNYNNITINTIENNDFSGIYMSNCSNNNVMYNFINYNGNGTKLDNGGYLHKIFGNIFKDNVEYGLIINHSAVETTTIYNNTFSGNLANARDDGRWNEWNTTSIGNTWKDYKDNVEGRGYVAQDLDDDGIGDVNYTISGSANSTDGKPIYDDGFDGDRIYIIGNAQPSYLWDDIWVMSWNEATSKVWCSGSGTSNDPYVIKDIEIDAKGDNSSIYIMQSQNDYFRIENCNITNSAEANETAGIYLTNVNYGEIRNNNCSLNGYAGIQLDNCNNITIIDNDIENNGEFGIFITNWCGTIDIENNRLKQNGLGNEGSGIHLENGYFNNIIYNNTLNGDNVGISLKYLWYMTLISENIIKSDSHGLAIIDHCDKLRIIGNTIYECGEDGIHYGWKSGQPCFNSTINGNNIHDNTNYGILLDFLEDSDISGNILNSNLKGVVVNAKCRLNTFNNNLILNNFGEGMLFKMGTGGNLIYNNNFSGNLIHAADFGLDPVQSNLWYKGSKQCGNYWDDYGDFGGKDMDDDGIGDDPVDYMIPGGLGISEDKYPIWWDEPGIKAKKPLDNEEFLPHQPPSYEINITEGRGCFFWYEIDGTSSTPMILLGNIHEIITGTVSLSLWDPLTDGTYAITFYVNDTQGYENSQVVTITKLNATTTTTPSSDNGGGDGTSDDSTSEDEEGLPWYIQAAMTGAVSASVGLIIKQSYSSAKKRRIILEKIHENFARVDNLEKFLKDKLTYEDWEKIQEAWQKYQNDEITERQMIKESKKTLGKRFTELFIPHKKSRRRT